jgi:hypothetical protein
MRRRRTPRSEDEVREKLIPAPPADPFEAVNGSPNGHAAAPPLEELRGAHVMRGETLTDELRGAHVMKGDPLLLVEYRALHAIKTDPFATPELIPSTPETAPVVSGAPKPVVRTPDRKAAGALTRKARPTKRQGAHSTASRRWGLVPVAGAAGALAVGLGGGGAFAFIFSSGSGSGQTTTGSPLTIAVTARTGTADLLPGLAGAAYFVLHNTNSFRATFDQVAPGAAVVSNNTRLCASSYVSIARALPYRFSPAVTVSPGGTSGIQSIAGIVKLASNAPSTCQGVTFTVTLTLSGQSS